MPGTIDGRAASGARFLFPHGSGTLEIRRAAAADARAFGAIRAAAMAEQDHLGAHDPDAFARDAAGSFARMLAESKLVAWLLCDGERVVGSACAVYFERLAFPDGTLHAEVCGVYVDPAYRGCGMASRLIERVVADVRSSPARKTFLRPASKARALYARLGFADDSTGVMSLGA